GIHVLVQHMGGVGAHDQRVAVTFRPGGSLGTDHAARAGKVLDNKGLTECSGKMICKVSGGYVSTLSCLVGHDDAHRLAGIVVGGHGAAREEQGCCKHGEFLQTAAHGCLLWCLCMVPKKASILGFHTWLALC